MLQARRSVMLRDLVIFLVKLAIDGLKDLVLMNLALGAAVLDLISGGGTRPRLFYSVLRLSERFDLWLHLNGAVEKMDSGLAGDDGLFGASTAGSDSLLGQIEELVRGGDTPRGRREPAVGGSGEADPGGPEGAESDATRSARGGAGEG
ncbi:hypothetical protein WI460_04070 [Gemmatimonadota bacterium Y43]|uniref:hypothetical protein n=1 Tax=Gaopeijia maritima TaxID=3119007 RepID=UPI00326C2570